MSEIAVAFQSGGLSGLFLLFMLVQFLLFIHLLNTQQKNHIAALSARDTLVASMVSQLADTAKSQSNSNLNVAIAISRIESRIGIPNE